MNIDERYLELAQEFSGDSLVVLKTDCFNEANDSPIAGGIAGNIKGVVKLIEIDSGVIDTARSKMKLDAVCGNIINMPFSSDYFDTVLDFSTIDHVEQYNNVLREYHRVLKTGGKVCVVYWSKEEYNFNGGQHFFANTQFVKDFETLFKIERQEVIADKPPVWGCNMGGILRCIVGVK